MKNNGLFSSLFIDELKDKVTLDDAAQGRMATLAHTWRSRNTQDTESLWDSFMKQALGYLEFVPPGSPVAPNVYPLYEDWGFTECISVFCLVPPESEIDDTSIGRFYPAKLLAQLKQRKLNWGILTDGARWRLYSTKSSRPYEDYVELPLAESLEGSDEAEYGLFERFFHKDSFIAEETSRDESVGIYKCRLDHDRNQSEQVLEERVKKPFLAQVDEVLQYICNGFIFDTQKSGEEYTEAERAEIFESAVKLIYRCLFLFYAEARRLLPTDPEKADLYRQHSIQALCLEARKFRWGQRRDTDQYDLWKHLKGLIGAVNDGDPEYGIMGYDGGLFDNEEELFLGQHQLRNDFLSRALYLLAFVEPYDNEPDGEYAIPYEDLEVRHLGELYENILEYTVQLADADRIRRRTKKGMEILLDSQTTKKPGDTLIKKGDVYFGESALERKQTGSYYTPESLVRFLNEKTIVQPLRETFEREYRQRFNEFLEQASNGHDAGTRRGASQSAAMLVGRFVEEKVLNFKVCDPAMGSGHFLVDAANQMAGLVVALLEEVPHVEGITVSITSRPNDWRRRITRHCLYGVDLNPLAVNLANLSLWLNCFAIEHKLTFLDHHVRCGNSLIGIRSLDQLASIPERKKGRKKKKENQTGDLFPNFREYAALLSEASVEVQSINEMDEDDTDAQKEVFDKVRKKVSLLKPLADLYIAYLMDSDIQPNEYNTLFYRTAKQEPLTGTLNPYLTDLQKSVETYSKHHHFFHWPLEFPDVFGPDAVGGFSATVGNPPWDIVKPNSQEFFSDYDPKFRSYKKQEANRVSKKLMGDNPAIAKKWEEYCDGFAEQSAYFKEPLSYSALGKGDINTFKLFLEQFFTVLNDGGRLGIVVPSGLYTDQGCHPLRKKFFNRSRVEFLYCFENRRVVFNIHRSFKFVLFGTQKGEETDSFKCAFMEHDPEDLPAIDANALQMSVKQVKKFSPDNLSILELQFQGEISTMTKIYNQWPLVGDFQSNTWNVKLSSEFHSTGDSHFFNENGDGRVLYEGKLIFAFDNHFQEPRYWIKSDIALQEEWRKYWKKLFKVGEKPLVYDQDCYRVGYRRIAASTNERAFICTVLPEKCVCPDTTMVIRRYAPDFESGEPIELMNVGHCLLLATLFNSFVLDFVIRRKITTHLDMHFVYSLPLPRCDNEESNFFKDALVLRAARLVCSYPEYSNLWKAVFNSAWQASTFWYPQLAPINNYGPAHEQEIRRRLRDEAKDLTPEWDNHCGVHDRLPDRRDTGDRAQLRAEIDAYVAHLYGLSRDDFAYILDTFPVLKKKEKKTFGEFMSKRKCLEEYDRIETIMNAE